LGRSRGSLRTGAGCWSTRSSTWGAVFSVLDPQIEFRPPPEHPDFGIYQGHEEVRRAFSTWLRAWDSIRFDVPEYVDAGERVLAAGRQWGKVKGSDTEVATEVFDVFTLRDGKVIRHEMFFDRVGALKAAGLTEDALK
jgi:ketosteroid isomerase-like protein